MEHQHTPKPPEAGSASAEAIAKGYEPHDIGLRGVIVFITGLVITLIVVLAFIYAVMMAMADSDRSTDAIASPVKVSLPPIYAPLQPSLGFYGDHDSDHDVLDAQDMILMRERTQQALNSEGITAAGRHFIPIASAIDIVISKSLLVSKPAIQPVVEPTYPPGSHEGVFPSTMPAPTVDPRVHVNDMNSLNPGDGD